MLREALDFPTSGDDGASAVIVGGGLLLVAGFFAVVGVLFPPLLGLALVAWLFVRGYYVRVLRVTARSPAADAPGFEAWGDLLVDGVKSSLVALAYLLPAVVLFVVAAAGISFGTPAGVPFPPTDAPFSVTRTVAGFALLFGLLYLVAMFYLVPAAVANFAARDRLGAAFHVRTVARGAVSEDYAVGWVLTVLLQFVLAPLVAGLQFLLVGFFLQFYLAVSVRYIYGHAFGRALDLPSELETEPAGGPGTAATPAADTRVSEPETNSTVERSTASQSSADRDPLADETNRRRGE